ncbi:MAG: DUF3299 domain-containing protein [Chloroherpetonaceae bacterium]|nr:DUF3299 domain-containing protein [Chloroherpetonaceae bacterium]MCS7211445.1 DUF3299 domain-containing protein [Chloroherpetonaceae bacterium]MDW8020020.1 DUF3299 domain-containing protein [Chloroherpetonaceae bacterium]MDW8466330.1 DUF3299 domain-containing protein [Chloroherpetonaceae bacterium]
MKQRINRIWQVFLIGIGMLLTNAMVTAYSDRAIAFQNALNALRADYRARTAHTVALMAQPASDASAEPTEPASLPLPDGVRLTFNDLREYRYSKRDRYPIPEKLKALQGKEVSIAGYMIPMSEALDVTEFMLVQIPFFGCCYSIPPEPNETVMVKMAKGKKTEYVYTPIRVTGKFDIQETKIDGFVVSLYQIEATSVVPAPNDKDVIQHQSGTPLPGRN